MELYDNKKFYDIREIENENLNFIIRDSKIQKCDFIIFNKYLQIPEKEVKKLNIKELIGDDEYV